MNTVFFANEEAKLTIRVVEKAPLSVMDKISVASLGLDKKIFYHITEVARNRQEYMRNSKVARTK